MESYCKVVGLIVAMLAMTCFSATASSQTITSLQAFRLNNSANSAERWTGDLLRLGANNVTPTTSYAYLNQAGVQESLYFRPLTVQPNQYLATLPYDPTLTGSWNLVASSDPTFPAGQTVTKQTLAIGNVAAMPFVQSMTVQGAGLTPTISWTLPASPPESIDQISVRIYDISNPVTVTSRTPGVTDSFTQADQIYTNTVASPAVNNFQIPTGQLQYGTSYSISITLDNLRSNGSVLSRSNSFFDFTPINPATLPANVNNIVLPTTVPIPATNGATSGLLYSFNVGNVSSNSVTFIDPLVATGFTYMTGAGDPNFKTVVVPSNIGDGLYDLFVWDPVTSSWILLQSGLSTNSVFDFTTHGYALGVDRFQIRDIETSANLSPYDMTGFVTGLTFVTDGSFTGTMQAIVVDTVPEPENYAMLLAGLGLLGFAARRRK